MNLDPGDDIGDWLWVLNKRFTHEDVERIMRQAGLSPAFSTSLTFSRISSMISMLTKSLQER